MRTAAKYFNVGHFGMNLLFYFDDAISSDGHATWVKSEAKTNSPALLELQLKRPQVKVEPSLA